MTSFWQGSAAEFLATAPGVITGCLAQAQIRHFRINETTQLMAWERTIDMLRATLAPIAEACAWHVILEYPMLRLGRRPDVILLTGRAILVLEFKAGAKTFEVADCRQVEDYAIDLQDFHAGSRLHPIVPILVAERAGAELRPLPLLLAGASGVVCTNAASLGAVLADLAARLPTPAQPMQAAAWLAAPYRPVPGIVEAACMLYAKHGVAEIKTARSDASNLAATTDAILEEVALAQAEAFRVILFVTGIPGAGKTLCGLNTIFGTEATARGTYLTGNPTLVHVLREALTRDAIAFGARRSDADRRMRGAIQRLPDFRNEYVARPADIPPERIVVIDEAQRCWSRAYAIAKTRDKPSPLSDSEPGHLLEAMSRHEGFACVICLVGGGQEIHDGEGGLAEWGAALRARAGWRVRAAPDIIGASDPRQSLGEVPDLRAVPALHLDVAMRQLRSTQAAEWVNRMLEGDAAAAACVAADAGEIPFRLTRNLADMRFWLRAQARGFRRCGLLASSGARRLRAEGLGAELPHMDASAVAHWFLDRFPADVRASDALEVVASEFSCQGLELDYVGLCWDGDLIREAGRSAWRARDFRGTRWTIPAGAEAIANQLNTYRVLLTRARYETVLFVPGGDAADTTRAPPVYDDIANFLADCGVMTLEPGPEQEEALLPRQQTLFDVPVS